MKPALQGKTKAAVRLATRGSALALAQARYVQDLLGVPSELVIVRTKGDIHAEAPLRSISGAGALTQAETGLFTREIQRAVLDGVADAAVHSMKDLPTEPVEGLTLAAVPSRGPVADVFVSHKWNRLSEVPHGGRLATGSPRRRAILRHRRPDLRLEEIRGNIDTRLRKLREEDWDGLVLAEAGLVRLGLADVITERLDPDWMVPAVGQGALAIEARSDDSMTLALLASLDHAATRAAVTAERVFLRALGGGCFIPSGALGEVVDSRFWMRAVWLDPDGTWREDAAVSGPTAEAVRLAEELAVSLLNRRTVSRAGLARA